MIIGNGDIAKVLTDKDGVIFFASGVSNSLETNEAEFLREEKLLLSQIKSYKLVYFSTLSIYSKDSPYTRHKKQMESLVKFYFKDYCIVRIGNITWGNNPNTLINSLNKKIRTNEDFVVRDEMKYIINKEDFLHWIELIPTFATEMNITGRHIKVKDIVGQLETFGTFVI